MEMVAFPVACGVLVDLLTLPLFPGSTLIGRLRQFTFLPVSWIAIHWALGAAFMLSFANYVSFLRSFCRPGLIYFLRNPADPDTHPLREMLERSFFDQVYRLAVSFAFYSFLTACSVGGAARIISSLPIAPLKVSFAEPIAEAPLVLLLHLCLRWLLTRLQPGLVLGKVYKSVAENVISSLGLSSYFLGKHPDNPGSAKLVAVPDFDRVYSRPAMKAIRTFRPASLNQTNKPPQSTIVYRPNMFALRCIAVVAVGFVICQLILAAAFSIPLTIGRILMPALENEIFILFAGAIPVIIGLSLLGGRGSLLVSRESMQKAVAFALSFIFAGLLWPIALGISFVLVTAPLLTVQPVLETALGTSDPINTFWTLQHEPLVHSIPIVFVTTCWSIGFPLLKICHMARNHLPLPQSTLDALNAGPTVSNYTFVFKVALPITVSLAAFIVLPPFIPLVMTALLSSSPLNLDSILPMQRVIHLSILLTWLVWRLGSTLGNSLGQVLANIRDDAYLVGRRLHNLERDEVHHDEATQGQQPATVRERRIPATPIL